jgi:hydrogenase nickel incorporation protein HypB
MERLPVERKVLNENDRIAGELRTQFARHNVLCLNLISSPGSGKTALATSKRKTMPRDWHASAFP